MKPTRQQQGQARDLATMAHRNGYTATSWREMSARQATDLARGWMPWTPAPSIHVIALAGDRLEHLERILREEPTDPFEPFDAA